MKILFLGNSITLHGIAHDIGWHWEWGMAASALEKDYVHVLARLVEEKTGEAVELRVRNIADFERAPDTTPLSNFDADIAWQPDVVILRICENTPADKVEAFGPAYIALIQYLQAGASAEQNEPSIFAVGAFWSDPAKEMCIRRGGELPGVTYVSLEHLHSTDYQAIGLFEHAGVAGHPSDRGMAAIAEAIFAKMVENGIV